HIHWTFLIVPAWIFLAYSAAGQGAGAMLSALGLILSVFACVLLHELGHALTAKRFGVKTRDITLLPIGGVARMERIPENPAQEFWIAVAGPAVNLVIAAAIFVGLAAVGSIQQLTQSELGEASIPGNSFWANLMGINIVLLV